MADKKIPELADAAAIAGTDELAVVQSATTKRATVTEILVPHTSAAADAHAASAITNTAAGNIVATTVQAAINELDSEKSATSHDHSGTYQPLDTDLTVYRSAHQRRGQGAVFDGLGDVGAHQSHRRWSGDPR